MGVLAEVPAVPDWVDVAVIGAGLAGLTAATAAARDGAATVVLDARSAPGGRARTITDQGFGLNEGPHALYRSGRGAAVLAELGIEVRGGVPPLTRSRISFDGQVRPMPPAHAIRQVTGLLLRTGRDAVDPGLVDVSAEEWIEGRVADPVGRALAAAMVRVSSYSGDLSTFSADAAATQLRAAMRGVLYLHGGWQQIVDALLDAAELGGAGIVRGAKATSIDADGDRWIVTVAGRSVAAGAVVIATGGPAGAVGLLGGPDGRASAQLSAAASAAIPVHAACLDLGLARLQRPRVRFVLGIDRPTYASVHTPAARLADAGEVLHVMHYEPNTECGVEELEAVADEIQPGWRGDEVVRQLGLRRVVAFDRPRPGTGLRGRQRPVVTDAPGLFVAGDWVGPDDLFGGAAIASGWAAGHAAARYRPARTDTVAVP